MLSRLLVVFYAAFGVSFVVAQSSTSIVCVPGQCLQGIANIILGQTLSALGSPSVHLLPGEYTASTTPELLHNLLTTPASTLSPSPGFNLSSVFPLPLNVALQPGLVIYSGSSYAGQAQFSLIPSVPINSSTPLPASSLALSNHVWAAVTSGSANNRFILWDAVPDVSQLPLAASYSLTLLDLQSSVCSPPCSRSGGVCNSTASCSCNTGFTGPSCETCATGFFGPTCLPCPAGCKTCDQGISGSGRCLTPIVSNAPETCNCLNGQCGGSNGQCICSPGWTTGSNGTACAQCAPGFYLTPAGDCRICEIACTDCQDGTGVCNSCKQGFISDGNDNTRCALPLSQTQTTGGIQCVPGWFVNGATCSPCSNSCSTCNGPNPNNCIVCATGLALLNGQCVSTDGNGVCAGTKGMIANNINYECDACGAKCTSCQIPNFNPQSIISEVQCTGCLPGSFLWQGKCVENCTSGNFVSPQDNSTCIACSPSCSTCLGSPDFCLTCPSPQFASAGQCVPVCPTGTFNVPGACLQCHPDCATCSGLAFNQCSTCPNNLPVLANGRCLPTCSKSQYFDLTTSSCQACDPSCSSCLDSGPGNCLACSSPTQVLRGGSCVSAGNGPAIPGLGISLSDLVQTVSSPSSTSSSVVPSATEKTNPTQATNSHHSLVWWKILLIVFAVVLISIVILLLWRRHARKEREKEIVMFANAKNLDEKNGWRRLLRRLFNRKKDEYDMDYRDKRRHRASNDSITFPETQQPEIQHPVIQRPVIQHPVIQRPVIQHPVIQRPVIHHPHLYSAHTDINRGVDLSMGYRRDQHRPRESIDSVTVYQPVREINEINRDRRPPKYVGSYFDHDSESF